MWLVVVAVGAVVGQGKRCCAGKPILWASGTKVRSPRMHVPHIGIASYSSGSCQIAGDNLECVYMKAIYIDAMLLSIVIEIKENGSKRNQITANEAINN